MIQKKYNDINSFDNSEIIYGRKTPLFIISWNYILLISLLLLLLIIFFYKYTIFNIYYAKVIKSKEENYIYMTVDSDYISLKNRNYLEIDGEEYKCKLKTFSDNYYYIGTKKYWDATYKCDLPSEINVNDNLIEVRVERRRTTLFNEILEKIKKGVKNARVKN